MIGHIQELNSESWVNLPWKQFHKDLFRLQKRTYKAQSRMAQSVARRDFDAPHRAEKAIQPKLSHYRN